MAREDFEGGVLSRSLEGGRVGARIRLDGNAVNALTADGEELSVSYDACRVERGGASGKMWFFRDDARDMVIFSEDPALQKRLVADPPTLLAPELRRLHATHGTTEKRSRLTWGVGLLVVVGLITAAVFGSRSLGRAAVHALPRSVDDKLGELAMSSMDTGGPVVRDAVLVDAVKRIEERLAPHVKPKLHFKLRVVQSDTVNAFALPGGQIVVFTGLLREAESAEEVAGVLAHEMAHVTRRHGMERIAQSIGVVAVIQLFLGDVSGLLAVGVELLQAGAVNSYGRDQEHEADMDAVDTLLAAKLDPEALAKFFKRLEENHGDVPGVLAWLGTHPELEQRVKDVREKAKKQAHAPFASLGIDFREVRRHAGAVLETPTAGPAPTP